MPAPQEAAQDRARPQPPWTAALAIAAVVAADQGTKAMARAWLVRGERHSFLGDVFRLELVRNPGAFLSLGADLPPAVRTLLFTWGVLALVLGAAWVGLFRAHTRAVAVGAALVAGGGLGNLWDRFTADGLVVDFLNLGLGRLRTGIFNVADVAIVAGALLLLVVPGQPRPPAPAGGEGRPG